MKRSFVAPLIAIVALSAAPAFANHEKPNGKETCDSWSTAPHYGLDRRSSDPQDWVVTGDPNHPWAGSTSDTAAVYAGQNGGSEGNATYSAGACGETGNGGGGQSNGGTTEVDVYQNGTDVDVVVVAEGGSDDPNNDSYSGINTGYDRGDGRANAGGKLCAGMGANSACTPVDTPVMCEKPTALGGHSSNWHDTNRNGCDLRM
jgi:hypothetical protein